jgi:anti-sigma regulatory factor (Ser/Thr protein kinase)
MALDSTAAPAPSAFRHEALLYRGLEEFVAETVSFVDDGLRAGEPVLVAVSGPKIGLLREALGDRAGDVAFADMAELGRNPARIIPAWFRYVQDHADGADGLRGVGEPIWPQRSGAELAESQRHEALLNLALADVDGLQLLCPYDLDALDAVVVDEARRTHPYVRTGGWSTSSSHYRDDDGTAPYELPLAEPPSPSPTFEFDAHSLALVREHVERVAGAAGLDAARTSDLVLAVNEVAANSIRHGGGGGALRTWVTTDRGVVCEVRDRGHIDDPLAGRREREPGAVGGRGLWIANQLCDLVELRSSPAGSIVRLHLGA